jgi:hypothetical protein
MSDVEKLGFLYSLQRLFGFGGDKPKPSQAATEPKKASSRHRRLLPRRLQASRRPRMCLPQSARRESPAHQAEVRLDGAKGASSDYSWAPL